MTEQVFQITVVWALLISSVAQAAVHLTTWWAMGPNEDHDDFGIALRRREASLGAKAAGRVLFEVLLVVLVTGGTLPFMVWTRDAIYSVTTVTAVIALWFGIRFLIALRRENWGRPVSAVSHQIERRTQDIEAQVREIGQTVRDARQEEES